MRLVPWISGIPSRVVLPALLLTLAGYTRPPTFVPLSNFCAANTPDATPCITQWLQAGANPNTVLVGTAGTYNYKTAFTLTSNLTIRCAADHQTRFHRVDPGSGLFLQATSGNHVENVYIGLCDFDVDGGTAAYLSVIAVNPSDLTPSKNIELFTNRFYDSRIAGQRSAAQRQYILLQKCDQCKVEGNVLTEGGRIKVGAPGTNIEIRNNTLIDVNDNAITVVDANNGGVSDHIRITGNRIINPLGVGIFFGVDGEDQTDPNLATNNVTIERNHISGDWDTACILGTLPLNTASHISITNNVCTKTGVAGRFAAGIALKRVNNATVPTQDIKVERNRVQSHIGWIVGAYAALNTGGIFVSGVHNQVTITYNEIIKVGGNTIVISNGPAVTNATITNNVIQGATSLQISGTFSGTVSPNTFIP